MFCEENKFYSGKLLTCAEPNKVINNFPPKFTEIKLLTIKSMTKRHLKSYQQLINNLVFITLWVKACVFQKIVVS